MGQIFKLSQFNEGNSGQSWFEQAGVGTSPRELIKLTTSSGSILTPMHFVSYISTC